DEPMWADDHVVAPTPGSAITISKTVNEFAIKENEAVCLIMFPLSLTREAKTWLDELNEGTIKTWDELQTAFISRFFPSALFDRLLGEIQAFSQHENESLTDAWLRMKEMLRNCHDHNLSKGNIIKIFYHGLNEITQEVLNAASVNKEFQSHSKPNRDHNDDDIPMSREEEAKSMQTFLHTRFYNDYRNRDSNHDNWRSSARNYYNRDNYQSHSDDKLNLQTQLSDFIKAQHSTSSFVKDTFMDLKNKLKTTTKNHQASIQNLEAKFDRFADKQSGRPSGSLPSNTQPNPKGSSPKPYQPPQARNEHLNPVFTRSGKSYDPPDNPNYQENDPETPINIDSSDKDDGPTPQPKPKTSKPNEGIEILHSSKGTILEENLFAEFDEFMAMTADENSESESDTEEPPFKKITFNTDYKIKISLEEPPTDLELKPLPDNLEYVFLEEPSFLPVIISSQVSKENKNKLLSVLNRHKQAFAWKTTDILRICPSFSKHKFQLLEDKKLVVQKQRRLNPNMQEVIKKK
ncbi:reverse transcriptase domain-containing protein, partial [Tanacetum coccineum]